MLGPIQYFIVITSLLLEAYVVVRSLVRKDFLRYFTLNFYMLAVALETIAGALLIYRHGFSSVEYRYFYYYSNSVLTVLLYLAVMGLYQLVFDEMQVSKYIRGAAVLLLVGTAWFSYMVVQQHVDHFTGRFVVELAQNLYFVGVVLTYVLWGAVLKLRETRARIIQLVLSLGVYFSANAATYALRHLFPNLDVLKAILPLVGLWLPLSWAYTFTRVSEEARVATARLAVLHR